MRLRQSRRRSDGPADRSVQVRVERVECFQTLLGVGTRDARQAETRVRALQTLYDLPEIVGALGQTLCGLTRIRGASRKPGYIELQSLGSDLKSFERPRRGVQARTRQPARERAHFRQQTRHQLT